MPSTMSARIAATSSSIGQIAAFGAALYIGGLMLQYPVGWMSDRMDRRTLVMWLSAAAAAVVLLAGAIKFPFTVELLVALVLGGIINPLYSLLSMVQMPGGIPVATFAIGEAGATNAALFAISILALNNADTAAKLVDFRQRQKTKVLAKTLDLP